MTHTHNIVVIVPIFIIALSPEAQKIFAAKHSMEKEFAASKVNHDNIPYFRILIFGGAGVRQVLVCVFEGWGEGGREGSGLSCRGPTVTP